MKHKKRTLIFITLLICMVLTAVVGIRLLQLSMKHGEEITDEKYDRYYVMITDDRKSSLWKSVYQGAFEKGKSENIYVEMLGDNLDIDYSKEQLMQIAIASKVDGIIVSADESEEMTQLINHAVNNHIPVVTVYGDNTQSKRSCFVGIGSYNLGREYGKKVIEIAGSNAQIQRKEPIKVCVIVNSYTKDYGQNILCSGIQETIEESNVITADISYISVDDTNAFSVEESIRDIFMEEELPDVFICLNELNTTCVYQAAIDYNKVGQIHILGYYDSEAILKAIERDVIDATATINTRQLGEYCVQALSEVYALGYSSQYLLADVEIIDDKNINNFLEQKEEK